MSLSMSFVHLHVHSHYSLLQAACSIPALIKKCVEYKMPAMALTDYGNMFGALDFYFEAIDKGINPILATEMYYVKDLNTKERPEGQNFRNPAKMYKTLVLLASNLEAYKNLCCLNTEANQKGFYFVPRADYKVLDKYKKGLIALTAAGRGQVPWLFKHKGKDFAFEEIKKLKKIFGHNLYLEFMPKGILDCKKYNLFLAEVAHSLKLKCVATGDVHYVEKKDSLIQDVLSCIGSNQILANKDRYRLGPSEFYFKSSQQIRDLFKSDSDLHSLYQTACDNSLNIANQCKIRFQIKDKQGRLIYHLPQLIKGEESLKSLTQKGLTVRLKEAQLRGEEIPQDKQKHYLNRIDYELDIIERMGFKGYFHIVYDFINWAKKNKIPVGPGRGSGASSLVSYCLGITDLDPLPLNLIFERFLNPERISMPDFDIDFCQENRFRVIDYINKKYGLDCSSHVITYGRLNVRAAIRDVGRVMALGYSDVDKVAKLIPNILGITLKEALKKEPRLKEMAEEDPKIEELFQLAGLLEGLIRHVSIHPAGIIIADHPIVNYAPLYRGSEGENVIQYDLKSAEKIGLVKFDFLGLKTLTHIAETLRLIKENQNKIVTTEQISLKDPGIYEIMSRGDTIGIFQFEGAGITDLLIKSQPTCFEDIIAINALYRPGPMSMIPTYLDRKKAREPVKYIFPQLEPILKETYGIVVYQEQVQQIAVEIAGYSYGEADVLRRAMGKKIRSVMQKQKHRFLDGARKKGYQLKKAEQLFELMAEFAKYGFNKSHAAAYCVLAAQTAWLKHYYPVEFLASQMTIEQNDSDKLSLYIRDVKEHGFGIKAPHINSSFHYFSIEKKAIRFSLSAVKGIGLSSAKEIVRARESLKDKKFSSLIEFFDTVDSKKINKKTLDSLIKCGAFDGFKYNRKEIFENTDKFISYSAKRSEDYGSGQQSLFENTLKNEDQVKISHLESWPYKESLFYEKQVFGFYLNDHPMKVLENLHQSLNCQNLSQLKQSKSQLEGVKTLAMMTSVREIVTKKKGRLMAFALLEDGISSLEVILFPEIYEQIKPLLATEGDVFCIKGRLKKDRGTGNQLVAESLIPLDDFLKQEISHLRLELWPEMKTQDLKNLKALLAKTPAGKAQVALQIYISQQKALVDIDSKGHIRDIEISHDFLQKVYKILKSSKRIKISGS